jgi:hypothetical protein
MGFSYYLCDWRHENPDDPVNLFYEVGEAGDVPRMIDVYANGRTVCQSLVDFSEKPHELPGRDSLVEGSFFEILDDYSLGVPDAPEGENVTYNKIPSAQFMTVWCENRGD